MGKGWKCESWERGKGRAEGKDGGQESGCIEVYYNAEGNPKWRAQREESPGLIQEMRQKHAGPRPKSQRQQWEKGETESRSPLHHGMALEDLAKGGRRSEVTLERWWMMGKGGTDGRKENVRQGDTWQQALAWRRKVKKERAHQASSWVDDFPLTWPQAALIEILKWLCKSSLNILYMPLAACLPPTPRLRHFLKRGQESG